MCSIGWCHEVAIRYHNVFDVSQKVSKVNVEEVARCGHHDVIVMTITDTLQWCIIT